jgi:hypothetical protein
MITNKLLHKYRRRISLQVRLETLQTDEMNHKHSGGFL